MKVVFLVEVSGVDSITAKELLVLQLRELAGERKKLKFRIKEG